MKAKVKVEPPRPPGWVYEPKWDGFRMIAWAGTEPRLDSRNGKPLLRYFPELRPALEQLPDGTVVDGEVVVVVNDATEFDSLQLRIHPAASRIERLSQELPAELVAFDLLADRGEDLRSVPYAERRSRLEELFTGLGFPWHLTPVTADFDQAARWFVEFEGAGCDGIICKATDGFYREDKRDWIKWKHRRDADCVNSTSLVIAPGSRIRIEWRSCSNSSRSVPMRVSERMEGPPGCRVESHVGLEARTCRGSRFCPVSLFRSATTSWRVDGSGTPPDLNGGVRISRRKSARWTNWCVRTARLSATWWDS
jgi:hypothetical protein